MSGEVVTQWALICLSPLPWAARLIAAIGLWASALWLARSYRGSRGGRLLIGLRLVWATLVVILLWQPALEFRQGRRVVSRLGVVLDRSASMALRGADGRSRAAEAAAFIATAAAGAPRGPGAPQLSWFDLAGPLAPPDLVQVTPPDGASSDLLAGLERAREGGQGQPLAALLLISDGADTEGLAAAANDPNGPLSATARQRLQQLGVPVNTVVVPTATRFADVAIEHVLHDDFAFVRNSLDIEVTLRAEGLGSLSLPVTLRREGSVLATQTVSLREGEAAAVHFRIKPETLGEQVFTVSVPESPGEALLSNNRVQFAVQVIRDKIRVLHVAGRPSWDERFLRQHLKEDPNVDLISFFILRTPSDDSRVPESDLSLIPFPVNKLFTSELRSFDVVIFQNFDSRPYRMSQYLPNLRDAIAAGLGFVMIGGSESLGAGGYGGTPLDDVLPLALAGEAFRPSKIDLQLTEAGRRHPLTQLATAGMDNEALWASLPALTGSNPSAGLRPGASALVRDGSNGGMPLVAAMEAGQGRSLVVASDALWRWRFTVGNDGGVAQRAYHRFWSNSLRWLVRDPEHARVRVQPAHRRTPVGEPADVTVQVLGPDYAPQPAIPVQLRLEAIDGAGPARTVNLVTDAEGSARHRFEGLEAGAFRATATPQGAAAALGSGVAVLLLTARGLEQVQPRPRPDLMAALARATGGRSLPPTAAAWRLLRLQEPDLVEVDQRQYVELWDNGWVLLLGLTLAVAEWLLRRRAGFI